MQYRAAIPPRAGSETASRPNADLPNLPNLLFQY